MALTPSDVMAGKVLVQLGLAKASDVRSALRALDAKGGLDLISRFSHHGKLEPAQAEMARSRVSLYERVWAEATYLRAVEKLTGMSPVAVARLLAETEADSLRLGAWLVRAETITEQQDADLLRKQQRRLRKEGDKIVERYRKDGFKGVARPLIHGSQDLDPATFTIARLFRKADMQALVEAERRGVAERKAAREDAANARSLRELIDASSTGLDPTVAQRVFASLLNALGAATGTSLQLTPAAVRVLPDHQVELQHAPAQPADGPVAWRALRAISEGVDGAAYAAPEAILQQERDERTDVYALGVVLFEMLTRQLPLGGESDRDLGAQHLIAPPATLAEAAPDREWPPQLEALLGSMLAKERSERPKIAALLSELDAGAADAFQRVTAS